MLDQLSALEPANHSATELIFSFYRMLRRHIVPTFLYVVFYDWPFKIRKVARNISVQRHICKARYYAMLHPSICLSVCHTGGQHATEYIQSAAHLSFHPSVHTLSVTRTYQSKTAEVRIMQFSSTIHLSVDPSISLFVIQVHGTRQHISRAHNMLWPLHLSVRLSHAQITQKLNLISHRFLHSAAYIQNAVYTIAHPLSIRLSHNTRQHLGRARCMLSYIRLSIHL